MASFFALSVRHRRHNPPKKWCPCEEVPLSHCQRFWSSNRRFSLGPAWLKTSKTSNHVTWDEFVDEKTLLWYFYGFLEQLSLTPSWCQTFRVPQSYIIGQNSDMTLENILLQTHHFFQFYMFSFCNCTCSWHRAASLLILFVAYHWKRNF